MNIFLWLLQVLLALLSFGGGVYKILGFDELAKLPATAALSRGGWAALGVFEMVCGILLVVPTSRSKPSAVSLAASAIGVESLLLAVVYARYSVNLDATNPLIWVVIMAAIALPIAYARYASSNVQSK